MFAPFAAIAGSTEYGDASSLWLVPRPPNSQKYAKQTAIFVKIEV